MKKIFVSVGEFLENGGELKENRDIYIDNNGKFVAIGIVFKVIEGNEIEFRHANGNMSVHGSSAFCYVQIDCTPHYV